MKLLLTYFSNWTGGGVKLCALYRGYEKAKRISPGDRVLCVENPVNTWGDIFEDNGWTNHSIEMGGKWIMVTAVSYREGDGHYVMCDSKDCYGHWIWNIH